MANEEPVQKGIYSNDRGYVCEVVGTALYKTQNKNVVVYYFDRPGLERTLLVEDVGAFLSWFKQGNYTYHGTRQKKAKDKTLAGGFKPGTLANKKA